MQDIDDVQMKASGKFMKRAQSIVYWWYFNHVN